MIRFTATKLMGTGKQGKLLPDAEGYYEMVIGGLNTLNSAGEYYTLNGAKELFDKSSIFQRRIANGCLKSELGHPQKAPGQSMDEFIHRILTVDDKNVACHIKEVWLDESYGRNNPRFGNPNLVAIMGKIKPAGPYGPSLQASLENGSENVCFSIRALTKDYMERGINHRVLTTIATFDVVNEGGIAAASKWSSPAMEEITHEVFSVRQLSASVNRIINNPVALESTRGLALEAMAAFTTQSNNKTPLWARW